MAEKFSEQERNYYGDLVGSYFLSENDVSIRKCIDSLKENYNIVLSIPTVKNYIHKYIKKNPQKGLEILKKLEGNKPKTVGDSDVKKRVITAATMFLENRKIENIADHLGCSVNVVYNDLTVRLKKIDIDLYNKVKIVLNEHKISNLNKGNNTYLYQERDKDGKFK